MEAAVRSGYGPASGRASAAYPCCVLQVVTKKYFREGVPLHTTEHRRVLYTNRHVVTGEAVDLPVGSLQASASLYASPFAFTATVVEHLEAKEPDGSDAVLIATSGDELIDDLAAVVSFRTNSLFSRDVDLVRRLISAPTARERGSAGAVFKDTFDADRFLPDAEIDELRDFMIALLDLRRGPYESVMRAIRRIVRATQRAVDDPTLAYVDLVAALESLAVSADEPPSWERLDGRKRNLIDKALQGADEDVAERVRNAVLEAEQAGARWRFEKFVLDHIGPEYFREEAVGELRPMRGTDVVRALNEAYSIRSRSVHSLDELPKHVTALNDQADTTWAPTYGVMFTLQGLARLARHVIGNVVARAPRGVNESFDWRTAVPGRLEMMAAPQYWLWQAAGFTHGSAARYFGGFADHVLGLWAGEGEGVPPMDDVLDRIEELVRGTQPGPAKTSMVGLYCAWHGAVHPELHRPNAQAFIDAHAQTLAEPSMVAFVTGLLCNQLPPEWTDDQWRALGQARRAERARSSQLSLAPRFDAALHAVISEKLHLNGQADDALRFAGYAIDELPGEQLLLDWEAALRDGAADELDIARLLTGAAEGVDEREPTDDDGVEPANNERTLKDENGKSTDDDNNASDQP
jgi:hypothetical protein